MPMPLEAFLPSVPQNILNPFAQAQPIDRTKSIKLSIVEMEMLALA